MNLQTLKNTLSTFAKANSLKLADLRILGGGAMMFYGLREETHDIDIYTTKEIYEKVKSTNVCTESKSSLGSDVLSFGDIDLHWQGWNKFGYDFGQESFESDDTDLGQFAVESVTGVLALKLTLMRDKDKRDIKKLRDYIEENSIYPHWLDVGDEVVIADPLDEHMLTNIGKVFTLTEVIPWPGVVTGLVDGKPESFMHEELA